MADITFADTLERILPRIPSIKHVIFLTDGAHMPQNKPALLRMAHVWCYEELLAAEWPDLPTFTWTLCKETQACGLCYTSGTTGRPKGVLYSHRSNWLLALSAVTPDGLDISSTSAFLVLVPMFHANAWGIPFAVPFVGGQLILPAQYLDGENVASMIEKYKVTHSAGVPTVWAGLRDYLMVEEGHQKDSNKKEKNKKMLSSLRVVVVGGATCPRHMIEYYETEHNAEVRHMWGMTELSPFGTLGSIKGTAAATANVATNKEAYYAYKLKQGWPLVFVDMRIVDDNGAALPHDGTTFGHLQVRGPHVVRQYYKAPGPAVDEDNWFDTGDVATIDEDGCMQITDRAKDVIKSGGEWISSIDIENLASSHPDVQEAAVIGVPHEKWGERPLLVVVERKKSATIAKGLTKERILEFLKGKIATWWMPDDVVFVDEIPHTATGKISKLTLRNQMKNRAPLLSSKL